jgi:hypothetical protein
MAIKPFCSTGSMLMSIYVYDDYDEEFNNQEKDNEHRPLSTLEKSGIIVDFFFTLVLCLPIFLLFIIPLVLTLL